MEGARSQMVEWIFQFHRDEVARNPLKTIYVLIAPVMTARMLGSAFSKPCFKKSF
jgi:hypothetical protein